MMTLCSGLALALALVLTASSGAQAQSTRVTRYRATIRAFLPATCMRDANEYYDAYQYDANGFGKTYISGTRGSTCAYWSDVTAGTIDGHPDFETAGTALGGFNVRTGIVQTTLMDAASGIPKVQYCASPRCGCLGTACATANATYFDAWYHDDPKYAKRLGFGFNLFNKTACTQDPQFGEVCRFEFNSATDDEQLGQGANDNFFGPLNQFVGVVTEAAFPDFSTAPAWPRTSMDSGSGKKFWFTTEVHTYFLFRGGESFTFSGDDDVWIFVNGQRVVDLGGVHSAQPRTVVLNNATAMSLNLTVGNIYEFDLFHAERHTSESNFRLETALGEACNVLRSGTTALDFDGSSATPAEAASAFFLSRNADFDATRGAVLLANASRPAAWSAVFGLSQFNVGSGFRTRFSFSVDPAGKAEGFAHVMQQRPGGLENLPASTGGNLGFRFLTNSLALVFDLCADRLEPGGDQCARHDVRLHYNAADPSAFNDASSSTLHVYEDFVFFRAGVTYAVEVVYLETPDWLEVYIDDSLYLRQSGFVVADVLGGGRNAYLGFTAATRGADAADVLLHSLSVDTVELDPAKTLLVPRVNASEPLVVVADGVSAVGLSVQTRDFCEQLIQYGGSGAFLRGLWVETPDPATGRYADANATRPQLLNATVRDGGDGTYAAQLTSAGPTGAFDLYVCFSAAGACGFDVTYAPTPSPSPLPLELAVVAADAPDSDYFFDSFVGAVRVIPQTLRPTSSPTVTAPTAAADTGSAVLASSVGGGSALFVLLVVGAILFVLRRRWQRDRAFIEEGALYNMEREVTYDKNDEYSVVGRMVLNTTAAIQRERAQKAGGDGTDADTLAAENAEMQEQIRINKQRQQEQQQAAAAAAVFTGGKAAKGKKKKEFAVSPPQL